MRKTDGQVISSERPLGGDGGNGEELVIAPVLVPHKVVADLHLGTQTQMDVLATLQGTHVPPQLRFCDGDPLAPDIGIIPTIDKSGECAQSGGEGESPHGCGLETVERPVPWILSLEIVFIHGLNRQGLGEIAARPVPGRSGEERMLETGGILRDLTG